MQAGSDLKRGKFTKIAILCNFLLNLRPNKLICLTFFFANYATKFGLVELTKLVSD